VDAVDSVEGWVTCSQSLDAVSDAASDTVSIAVMSTTEELFCVELVYGKKKEESSGWDTPPLSQQHGIRPTARTPNGRS